MRIKILFLIVISFSLLLINRIEKFSYAFILLIAVIIISKIKIKNIFKGIVPIIWLIGISFILHSLIPPRNIGYAVEISLRLLLIFCWATIMTATMPNIQLAKAISWYAYPLKIFGISPENVALTFSLSLRFFPVILEEADSIIKAQRLRKEKLKFTKRIEAFCSVFMVRVLNKASSIELSLLNRNIKEENLKRIGKFKKLTLIDYFALIICLGYVLILVYI